MKLIINCVAYKAINFAFQSFEKKKGQNQFAFLFIIRSDIRLL